MARTVMAVREVQLLVAREVQALPEVEGALVLLVVRGEVVHQEVRPGAREVVATVLQAAK